MDLGRPEWTPPRIPQELAGEKCRRLRQIIVELGETMHELDGYEQGTWADPCFRSMTAIGSAKGFLEIATERLGEVA